jgi:hypothetical protein
MIHSANLPTTAPNISPLPSSIWKAAWRVASYSPAPDFDASAANAAYTDFVQANRDALKILGAAPSDTTVILVTTNGMHLIVRELGEAYYLGTAISQEGNLALVVSQAEVVGSRTENAGSKNAPSGSNAASRSTLYST